MKKGQMCEGVIEYIDFPNKGRVKVEDQYVTVKNGIPGQKIRFVINKKRKDRCEGRLLEVLEKSPLETIEPVCHEFPACGTSFKNFDLQKNKNKTDTTIVAPAPPIVTVH